MKTQVENGLEKLFDLWYHNIYMYDQDIVLLTDTGLHDEKGENPIRATQ